LVWKIQEILKSKAGTGERPDMKRFHTCLTSSNLPDDEEGILNVPMKSYVSVQLFL
jgi:hypothetical protein